MYRISSAVLILVLTSLATSVFADPPEPPTGKHWEPVPSLTDEFNGNEIDANKWYDYHPFWSGRVPSQFKKGNAFVKDGKLLLRNGSRIDNMNQVNDPYNDVWIDAAAVVSKEKNSQVGWYYETSMKASDCAMSSSFWFRVGKFSEIDVIEHIGRATKPGVDKSYDYSCNTHVYGNQSGPSVGKTYKMSTRGRDEFHVYGLWWKTSTDLRFYHNDEEVMQVTPSVSFNEKLHMIWDTEALIPNWVGLATIESLKDNTRNTMYVDWVRTWKLVDGTPIINNKKPLHKLTGLNGDVTFELRDIRGRILKSVRINNLKNIEAVTKELRVQRNGLSAGLYLFRFITSSRIVVTKKMELF
jgi:hypothetical protein